MPIIEIITGYARAVRGSLIPILFSRGEDNEHFSLDILVIENRSSGGRDKCPYFHSRNFFSIVLSNAIVMSKL